MGTVHPRDTEYWHILEVSLLIVHVLMLPMDNLLVNLGSNFLLDSAIDDCNVQLSNSLLYKLRF